MSKAFPVFSYYESKRLHFGICGSIAAYKSAELVRRFQDTGLQVSVTLTPSARKFISPLTFEALGAAPVYTDMFSGIEPFEHLEPGQTAQAMLIAPASATTMARLAHGMADEMLACQALAFDGPILLAPAMNPRMWANPATLANKEILQDRGIFFVEPACGAMACHDEGQGRLAEPVQIYFAALKLLTEQDMFGKKVLVTLGPTQEPWDAVRFWTNGSSGSMGAALALAAWLRGAEVHAVAGPVSQLLPEDGDFHRYNVRTAQQMFRQSEELWDSMDMGIFTAAVADFRPISYGDEKFKKENSAEGFAIDFLPNADILRTLGAEKRDGQQIMGFAAESGDRDAMAASARRKLAAKNCDMLVGNLIAEAMGKDNNRVFVTDVNGGEEFLPVMEKTDLAWKLLDRFLAL